MYESGKRGMAWIGDAMGWMRCTSATLGRPGAVRNTVRANCVSQKTSSIWKRELLQEAWSDLELYSKFQILGRAPTCIGTLFCN